MNQLSKILSSIIILNLFLISSGKYLRKTLEEETPEICLPIAQTGQNNGGTTIICSGKTCHGIIHQEKNDTFTNITAECNSLGCTIKNKPDKDNECNVGNECKNCIEITMTCFNGVCIGGVPSDDNNENNNNNESGSGSHEDNNNDNDKSDKINNDDGNGGGENINNSDNTSNEGGNDGDENINNKSDNTHNNEEVIGSNEDNNDSDNNKSDKINNDDGNGGGENKESDKIEKDNNDNNFPFNNTIVIVCEDNICRLDDIDENEPIDNNRIICKNKKCRLNLE